MQTTFLFFCTFISALILSFQSPDEFERLKRTYTLYSPCEMVIANNGSVVPRWTLLQLGGVLIEVKGAANGLIFLHDLTLSTPP